MLKNSGSQEKEKKYTLYNYYDGVENYFFLAIGKPRRSAYTCTPSGSPKTEVLAQFALFRSFFPIPLKRIKGALLRELNLYLSKAPSLLNNT